MSTGGLYSARGSEQEGSIVSTTSRTTAGYHPDLALNEPAFSLNGTSNVNAPPTGAPQVPPSRDLDRRMNDSSRDSYVLADRLAIDRDVA
jgi:hypothetical protein